MRSIRAINWAWPLPCHPANGPFGCCLHPASTTHGRLAPEVRQAMGVGEDLLRLSVGLEEVEDLQADLARGLDAIGG